MKHHSDSQSLTLLGIRDSFYTCYCVYFVCVVYFVFIVRLQFHRVIKVANEAVGMCWLRIRIYIPDLRIVFSIYNNKRGFQGSEADATHAYRKFRQLCVAFVYLNYIFVYKLASMAAYLQSTGS